MKNLSFREMSALGSALAIALMAWLYFPDAFMLSSHTLLQWTPNGSTEIQDKSALLIRYVIGMVIFLLAVQIIYRIIIGILWRRDVGEKRDERDLLVDLKARRAAYRVLGLSGCLLVGRLLASNVPSSLAAQYVLLVLFVGEFVRYFATFIYYRLSI